MDILSQYNQIAQAIISNGLVTGNTVQNPNNLLNTTDSTASFGATSDVIIGNFPFNLPTDAVIVGIKGIIKAQIDNNSVPAGSLTPVLVDATSGTNEYFPGTPVVGLSNVLQEYEIGGAYDLWGNANWTAVKINNLQLQLIGNSSLEVAWASMTVFYYIPVTSDVLPPFALPGCDDCDSEIQALPFELKRVWRANETTLLLKSFNLPNGTPITLDMLGECGGSINLTIDPDLRKEDGGNFIENFNIDSTIASINITAQGVEIDLGDIEQRGLGFDRPYGYDADNISEHAVGAVVIITNNGPYNSKLLKRCHIGTLVSAPITVEDEGNIVAEGVDNFNFRGANVQATQDPSDPYKVNVDVIVSPTNTDPLPGSTSSGTNGTTPSTTLTISHTILTDENYLRVWVSTQDVSITSVTYNGDAMTLVASETDAGADLKGALYGLINPDLGTHNIVITVGTASLISGGGVAYKNVDTSNPTVGVSTGNSGTSNAATDSITTTIDNVLVQDVVSTKTNPTTFTQYGLWTIQSQVNAAGRPGASSTRKALAPQVVNDQYGLNSSMDWVIVLAGVRGIANAPAGGVQSVTGLNTDNTDPANPIVQISVDGSTITGDGTPGNPLVATTSPGSTLDVQLNGVSVQDPVDTINFIAPAGTVTTPAAGVVDVDLTSVLSTGTLLKADPTAQTVTFATPKSYTISIPGGTLSDSNAVRFKVLFQQTPSASTIGGYVLLNATYGGVLIDTANTAKLTASGASSVGLTLSAEGILMADGTTGDQKGYLSITSGISQNVGQIISTPVQGIGNGSISVDSTVDQDLVVTISVDNNINNNVYVYGILVEKVV